MNDNERTDFGQGIKKRPTRRFGLVVGERTPIIEIECLEMVHENRQLNNKQRERLLHEGRGYYALVLEGLLFGGVGIGEWIDVETAMQTLPHTPEKVLRRGLQGFKRRLRLGGKGRPRHEFRVPDPDSVRVWDISLTKTEIEYSDQLPGWAFRSMKHYRAALHLALIVRRCRSAVVTGRGWSIQHEDPADPGQLLLEGEAQIPRRFLADRLGVVAKTTRNYERWLGIASAPGYSIKKVTWKTFKALPVERKSEFGRFLVSGSRSAVGQVLAGAADWGKKYPAVKGAAARLLRGKQEVWLVMRGYQVFSVPKVRFEDDEDRHLFGYTLSTGRGGLSATVILERLDPDRKNRPRGALPP